MRKAIIFFAFIVISSLLLGIFTSNTALAAQVADETITSAAAIVMDFDTGLVIFEYNAHEQRVPASMTKMVTAYVVLDAIEAGIVNFDTLVPTNEENAAFSVQRGFSNIAMPVGSEFTIRELMEAAVVRSASAATVQMGEAAFGTDEETIAAMNQKLAELGIEGYFADSWGLSPDNSLSAHGMAEITKSLINSHPIILEITAMEYIEFNGEEYRNTNFMLRYYENVDGFKTGFTTPAGWCFAGTAVYNGRRLITVTMGSEQGERFADTRILLDYGIKNVGAVIAEHIMGEISAINPNVRLGSPLMPISHFNVELAEHFTIRELAIILNEN
ncbi:MAG: serine hydrolase [Oscillospiraceae bacterium]|nr:serine hydrolase [Oscillospiraceae bacterium]